jgi:NAD(P)-dependent dehydrogenase (short-subunit alcohol dehydrogenase family)
MLGVHSGLAIDLAAIRVNLMTPGAIETEIPKLDQKSEEEAEIIRKKLSEEILTGQVGGGDIAVALQGQQSEMKY